MLTFTMTMTLTFSFTLTFTVTLMSTMFLFTINVTCTITCTFTLRFTVASLTSLHGGAVVQLQFYIQGWFTETAVGFARSYHMFFLCFPWFVVSYFLFSLSFFYGSCPNACHFTCWFFSSFTFSQVCQTFERTNLAFMNNVAN